MDSVHSVCQQGVPGHEQVQTRILLWGLSECLLSTAPYIRWGQLAREDKAAFHLVRSTLHWLGEPNGPLTVVRLLKRAGSFPKINEEGQP